MFGAAAVDPGDTGMQAVKGFVQLKNSQMIQIKVISGGNAAGIGAFRDWVMGDKAVDACCAGQFNGAFSQGHHNRYFFDGHIWIAPDETGQFGHSFARDTGGLGNYKGVSAAVTEGVGDDAAAGNNVEGFEDIAYSCHQIITSFL